LITKCTIDELLSKIQKKKSKKINKVMSEEALNGTNTMEEVLSMFGKVTVTDPETKTDTKRPGGAFRISAYNPAERARFWENLRNESDT
jgi:hypothetical protein